MGNPVLDRVMILNVCLHAGRVAHVTRHTASLFNIICLLPQRLFRSGIGVMTLGMDNLRVALMPRPSPPSYSNICRTFKLILFPAIHPLHRSY